MKDCVFVSVGIGEWKCVCCGVHTPDGRTYVKPPRRNCGGGSGAQVCQHRGKFIGSQECDSCQGRVRIKTFACAVHADCTLAKKLPNLACCAGCQDYSPSKRDPDPDSGLNG